MAKVNREDYKEKVLKRILSIVDRAEKEAEEAYPDEEGLEMVFFKVYLKSALRFLDLD